MSNDNVLRKEFSKKDVERARNLIKGDTNARTSQGVGYTKKSEHHKEGDIWNEDGRKWTIKNGIKQNITKMDKFKKMGKIPLFCPECSSLMKKELDKKVYPAYQKCFDCVVDHEAELKKQGKYEEYERKKMTENAVSWLKRAEQDIEILKKAYTEASSNVMNADGLLEHWSAKMTQEEFDEKIQNGFNEFKEKFLNNINTKEKND